MNRADLAWALNAVIPHAGNAHQGLDHVGLTYRDGALFVYATDKYTAAVARVNDGAAFDAALQTKEATDLLRFVRPNRVPEREQEIGSLVRDDELHIGFWAPDDPEATAPLDSAVFETCEPKLSLDYLLDWIRRLNDVPELDDNLIVQPKLLEKFAKAARADTDRLWILPRHASDRHGAAVVAAGADFIGAIAGLTYDQLGDATVASFLYPERKAA